MKKNHFVHLTVAEVKKEELICFTDDHEEYIVHFSEKHHNLNPGSKFLAISYIQNGISYASQHLEKIANEDLSQLKLNQKVDLYVISRTELGFKCIIDGQYIGLLYHNEVFQPLQENDQLTGYIKNIREDHRIDLILRAPGHKATTDIGEMILEELKINNGFLAITDKTSPEVIYEKFKASKKKFKIALGGLYKARKITISDDGIHLVKS